MRKRNKNTARIKNRLSLMILLLLTVLSLIFLFSLKYRTLQQKELLQTIEAEVKNNNDNIHILEAEFSYLSNVQRIHNIYQKNNGLELGESKKITTCNIYKNKSKGFDCKR